MSRWSTWKQRLQFLLLVGVLVPILMTAAGLLLVYIFHKPTITLMHLPSLWTVGAGVLTAVLSMAAIAGLFRLHKGLEKALRDSGTQVGLDALREYGYPVMLAAVALAAFGEELLFRGGFQPVIGLIPAALLFGFSHGGWRRENWAYVAAAALSGSLFGLLYKLTGDIWAPVTAHATHNMLSTGLLGKKFEFTWNDGRPTFRLVPDESGDEPSEAEDETMPDSAWATPYPMRPTARQMGLSLGILPAGPKNDITDVAGVKVGHATVVSGEGALVPGQGPVRTGVTAILPHGGNLFTDKVPAGLFVLNGFGKSTGLAQIQELGTLETPILLTNTLSVFRAADALVSYMVEQNPAIGISTGTVNAMVGECNDGYLSDIQGRHVTEAHVRHALGTASSDPVQQGAVGAGTGMTCYGFKGGIGSSSRAAEGYTLGALVLANFGRRSDLMLAGVPVGQRLLEYPGEEGPEPDALEQEAVGLEPENVPPGSVMVILATDAPLDARQLTRLSKRGALGLARTGASAANGSGDFVLSFSTAHTVAHQTEDVTEATTLLRDDSRAMDRLFLAAVEAVEEAVVNALFTARTVQGRDEHRVQALPVRRVLDWVTR